MATIVTSNPGKPGPNSASLSAAQTGNGVSTNVCDRGGSSGPALVTIVTTVGATPTCTYAIEVSVDGADWFPGAYADTSTPGTLSAATFAVTTATTTRKILPADQPWRFARITYSSNTNVTNTASIATF